MATVLDPQTGRDELVSAFVRETRSVEGVREIAVRRIGAQAEFIIALDDPWAGNMLRLAMRLLPFEAPELGVSYRTIKTRWNEPIPTDYESVYRAS
jgi:hypothetical protein